MNVFIIGGATCGASDPDFPRQVEQIAAVIGPIGHAVATAGHRVVACSAYADSADVPAIRGAASAVGGRGIAVVDLHYPNEAKVSEDARELVGGLPRGAVAERPCPLPTDELGRPQMALAWQLAHHTALDDSVAVIAIGGKLSRSASLLLLLAEARRMPVLPLASLGGAARQAYDRRFFELQDRLGPAFVASLLQSNLQASDIVDGVERLAGGKWSGQPGIRPSPTRFFISYARARPAEADLVETLLRRRGHTVFRDDPSFSVCGVVGAEVFQHVHRADVFISLWCAEYACSPWCFDEMILALQRLEGGSPFQMWILAVDDTRVVPPAARQLISHPAKDRAALEGKLLALLDGLHRRTGEASVPA